jgi:hypothetical protein
MRIMSIGPKWDEHLKKWGKSVQPWSIKKEVARGYLLFSTVDMGGYSPVLATATGLAGISRKISIIWLISPAVTAFACLQTTPG